MGGRFLHAPPCRIHGGKGKNQGGDDQTIDPERDPCRSQYSGLPLRRQRPEPAFAPRGAGGQHHGVSGGKVVVAPASGHEEGEREDVHSADQAPAPALGPGKEKP